MRSLKIFSHIFVLLILSLILLGYSCQNKLDSITAQTLENISPEESENLIAQNGGNSDFVILDVRTLTEFNSGHIANAIQIDYYADDFNSQLEKLDKEKTYLIYCRTGNRSSLASSTMQELGFKKIYNMIGGINQWKAEERPVTTNQDSEQNE